MAEFVDAGWLKLHRTLFGHPVWKRPPAAMAFLWLLAAAAPSYRFDRSFGRSVAVERGELVTSVAEMAGWLPFTPKQIRGAMEYLRREGMVLCLPCPEANCTRVSIVNYPLYQDRKGDSPMEGEADDAGAAKKGQAFGQADGQADYGKKGKPSKTENPLCRSGKRDGGEAAGASRNGRKGHAFGQADGQAINKEEEVKEVKETNYPPTPRAAGGVDASALLGNHDDRVRLVLGLWREAWAAAGRPLPEGVEGRNTRQGAEKLAREYLGACRLSVEQLRGGMAAMVRLVTTDEKCARYDLRTLANNPDKYVPAVIPERAVRRKIRWRFECDVCGYSECSPFMDAALTPAAYACGKAGDGCQGKMVAVKDQEIEG